MYKRIIQHGRDGLGHQLQGLFSCLILDGVDGFVFDTSSFVRKKFRYQHVGFIQSLWLKFYMQEVVRSYSRKNNINKNLPCIKSIHKVYEIENLPKSTNLSQLFIVDNAFRFGPEQFSDKGGETFRNNINVVAKSFVNKRLPKSNLPEKHIVIHFRFGDAMFYEKRAKIIKQHYKNVLNLLEVFKVDYPGHTYVIHSDGDVPDALDLLKEEKVILRSKKTSVLRVFSDFVNAKIFVGGASSLSFVAHYLGEKKLSIGDDSYSHITPEGNYYKISDYMSLRK